jgi:hypothetical protein
LVGGSIGLALAHAFEAAYVARTIISPITSSLKKISDGVAGLAKSNGGDHRGEQAAAQTILAQHQRQTSADKGASAADGLTATKWTLAESIALKNSNTESIRFL